MNNVTCPYCKKQFPLSEGLSHELKEKLEYENQKKLEEAKNKMNEDAKKWREKKEQEIEEKAREKIELDFKNKQNEAEELRKEKTTLQNQVLEISKSMRQLKTERDQEKIENEKRLVKTEEAIKQQAKETAEKEYKFKLLEKDKQLQDAIKVADEFKRKAEQKSQQLQGEVLELEIEEMIKKEFPYDEIQEVPKGIRGADIIQVIKNNYGKECGSIIWELKRTKAWNNEWIKKLKDDQRVVNAALAVLVTNTLPEGIKHFGMKQEVWICSFEAILGVATILRDSLIKLQGKRASESGKEEKKEILWNYLTGIEFKQRIETVYDAYTQLQEDIEKEKRWFTLKWAKEEKNIRKVIDSILGMSGDLQSIVGKSLPEIKGFELPSGSKEKNTLF